MSRTEEEQSQMELIDVAPENAKAIIKAARIYKKFQCERLDALKKEAEQKQKVLALIKESNLKPVDGGIIKFSYENVTISVTPRDELVKIKEESEQE